MGVAIGELLLKENLISHEQPQQALGQQKSNGGKLGYNLVKMGFVKDDQITALLSKQYGVPAINLSSFKIDLTIIKLVPTETARKYQIIPLSRSGSTLTIAMTDPTNVFAMDDIKFMTGYTVEPVVASEVAITDAIEKYYPSGKAGAGGGSGGGPGARGGGRAGRGVGQVVVVGGIREGPRHHPNGAVRKGAARRVPHRGNPLHHQAPADEIPRCDRLAHQDHVEARH